jgi:hypothetical protein
MEGTCGSCKKRLEDAPDGLCLNEAHWDAWRGSVEGKRRLELELSYSRISGSEAFKEGRREGRRLERMEMLGEILRLLELAKVCGPSEWKNVVEKIVEWINKRRQTGG